MLKGFDVLGEVDALKTVLEFLSIDGEIEEPLAHFLLHHGPVTPPTAPRLDLFVRKYGGARSAPVHRSVLASGETVFHEFREKPLVPLVVAGVVTFEGTTPIVRESHSLDLLGDGGHVSLGDVVRMTAFSDGCVLGWHTEGIEAHGIENIKPHQALEASDGVAN